MESIADLDSRAQSLNEDRLGKDEIRVLKKSVKRCPMTIKDLKRVGLLVMAAVLVGSAPQWLNPANQHVSNYDAPWVYPGLAPAEQH